MLYTGNPTAGLTDGTPVSENGVMSSPITGQVAQDGTVIIKCAARAPQGESADITINACHIEDGEYVSGGEGRLLLSETGDPEGAWSFGLQLSITDVNTIFYIMLVGHDDAVGTYSNLALEVNTQ